MMGLKRGLYSNEAGIGSVPNAAASATTSHPAKQGLVQMMAVYLDTWVICSATAFMLLASGIAPNPDLAGAPYNVAALTKVFGPFGQHFFTFSLFLFGFTTLLGNYFYSEANLRFIARGNLSRTHLTVFRLIAVLIIFVGAGLEFGIAWDTADVLMAAMALINIPVIFVLKDIAIDCLHDYTRQKQEGSNPVFRAKDIDLKDQVDFWGDEKKIV